MEQGSSSADQLEPFDAIGDALLMDRFKPRALGIVGGNDQLAATPMRNAMLGAESIQHAIAAWTMLRPQ